MGIVPKLAAHFTLVSDELAVEGTAKLRPIIFLAPTPTVRVSKSVQAFCGKKIGR
jgi:hypothetical protein